MKATLSNYRQSPRKVRLVADLIKGKSIAIAETELAFLVKRAATPFHKLLMSAVANALQAGASKDALYVKDVRVDKGVTLKRSMPRAMGRASRINKRASHVIIVLAEREVKAEAKVAKAKATKAPKATKTVKAKEVAS